MIKWKTNIPPVTCGRCVKELLSPWPVQYGAMCLDPGVWPGAGGPPSGRDPRQPLSFPFLAPRSPSEGCWVKTLTLEPGPHKAKHCSPEGVPPTCLSNGVGKSCVSRWTLGHMLMFVLGWVGTAKTFPQHWWHSEESLFSRKKNRREEDSHTQSIVFEVSGLSPHRTPQALARSHSLQSRRNQPSHPVSEP